MIFINSKTSTALLMMLLRASTGWMPVYRNFVFHDPSKLTSSLLLAPISSRIDSRNVIVGRTSGALFSTESSVENKLSDGGGKSEMVNVTLETASQSTTISVQKGEILRTALLRKGASPHNGRARLINCRGLGTCGTCAVEIQGKIKPAERNAKEKLRLNFPPHGSPDQSPNLRLACQVQVQDEIVIRKRTGFWGQDTSDELAEAYDAELWFGDLEYVLDNKSPPPPPQQEK